MPVKPAPVPIAPLASDYRRLSSSNSSRKRSYVESVGARDRKGGVGTRGGAVSNAVPPDDHSHQGLAAVQQLKNSVSAPQVPASCTAPTYHYIGSTTQFEPLLCKKSFLEQDSEIHGRSIKVQRVDDNDTYAQVSTAGGHVLPSLCIPPIESKVQFRLNRDTLSLYFTHVNSVLPLLNEAETWHLFHTSMLDPTLSICINLVSQRWKEAMVDHSANSAVHTMEEVAMQQFHRALAQPLLSTVQAGLLLVQSSTRTPYLLSTQLTTIGYELGLHQDCSYWKISPSAKTLRKRLGWMLYAQDKWFSLLHGRPSYVSPANWTISALSEQDFDVGVDAAVRGPQQHAASASSAVFMMQFTTLTQILSAILEIFHTLGAEADVKAAGSHGLRLVLDRAKPVQIQLKNWFAQLPESLKVDASSNDTVLANGSLQLAYFATEITLHRCIIRATAHPETDSYLSYICRSAAKTRLISAMDFVNRLRPVHLQSFWPFAGFSHFGLVGTFGALLEATAPLKEEAEFYHMRLEEYRWTLMVSRSNAEFLDYAIDSLDTNLELLRNLPDKPGSGELELSHSTDDTEMSGSTVLDPGHGRNSTYTHRGQATRSFSGLVSPATSLSSSSSSSSSGGSTGQGCYIEPHQSR